jgi:hypothetical protein
MAGVWAKTQRIIILVSITALAYLQGSYIVSSRYAVYRTDMPVLFWAVWIYCSCLVGVMVSSLLTRTPRWWQRNPLILGTTPILASPLKWEQRDFLFLIAMGVIVPLLMVPILAYLEKEMGKADDRSVEGSPS